MSSPKDGSMHQIDSAKTISIENIIKKVTRLHDLVMNEVKIMARVDVPEGTQGRGGIATANDEWTKRREVLTQLQEELDRIITGRMKMKTREYLAKPFKFLECNVEDILKDLQLLRSSTGSLKQIEHNLKVLRSNIIKVKIQIPLQHQASNLISDASRYLQATVASREEGDLPNLYEAAKILEIKGSFYEEIQDKYDGLDENALKLCLLCFAIFPENAEIKKSLLRFWWLGERFIEHPNVLEEKEKKDPVNDVLGVLIKERFIEPIEKKSRLPATSYKMHPIIRSLLIRLAKEANFFDYDSEGNPTMDISASKKVCLIKSEGPSQRFYKNGSQTKVEKRQNVNTENQQKTYWKWRQQKNSKKPQQKNLEELQTLFNINKQFPNLPAERFSKMRGIGVLYLGRWESTAERVIEVESTEFLKGLVNMKKLRLMSLQGISGISELPESLGKLINLRILDLRACHNLDELPKELGSLKRLAYLDISECYLIDNMPKQLTSLLELQVLKGFVISKNRHSCTLGNLATLSKLNKLTINVNSDEFSIDKAQEDLCRFQGLRKLRIAWGAGGDGSSKLINGNKDEMKSNGNKETNGDKRKVLKGQQNDAAKSVLWNLKMPWGATTEKCTLGIKDEIRKIDYGKQESREGKKQGSDAAKSRAKNLNDNKDAGKKTEGAISLEKLDLQCFPRPEPPSWLVPGKLASLKSLYIRGGKLSYLGEFPEGNKEWEVETLRLKYLSGVQINWKDLQTQFPLLTYLESVDCPGITFCPCDANGVWQKP